MSWLPKESDDGDKETNVPVPLRLTVCGLLPALSVMLRVPVREPLAVGLKLTLIVQDALTATEAPHVLV